MKRKWILFILCFWILEYCVCYGSYAGEFGGFDIEIGGTEGFSDWDETEVTPGNQVEENLSKTENAVGSKEENTGESENVAGDDGKEISGRIETTVGDEGKEISSGTENAAGDGGKKISSGTENTAGDGGKEISGRIENTAGDDGKEVSGGTETTVGTERKEIPGRTETTAGDNGKGTIGGVENETDGENRIKKAEKGLSKKKAAEKEIQNSKDVKIIGTGIAAALLGTSRVSAQLKFYNNNNENKDVINECRNNNNKNNNSESNNNENDNNENNTNNKKVYYKNDVFEHVEKIPKGECPVIKIKEKEDITILSLRLNGKEVSWHQKENMVALDQPVSEKENQVELIAVEGGKKLIRMPTWSFCYLDEDEKQCYN